MLLSAAYNTRYFLLTLILVVSMVTKAQTVKKIEYFFDSDPGLGNGIQINLAPASEIDTTLIFNVSSLTQGLHQLFIRAQDSDDQWSLYHVFPIIKGTAAQPTLVQKLEYYFDNDPGVGNGTAINFLPSGQIDTTVIISTASLSVGLHKLFIRAMDNGGRWSFIHSAPVIAGPGYYQPLTVNKIEFFLDNDTGVGNGIQVALQPGFIVDTIINLPLPTASNDTVHLYVRAMDNRGMWGLYHDTTIVISCALYTFQPDFIFSSLRCVSDSISFTTMVNAAEWRWHFGDGDTSAIQNPKHVYNQPGSYDVTLYTISSGGCMSDTMHKTILINPTVTVYAGPDQTIYFGDIITLNPVITGNDSAYLWIPNLYLNNNTIKNSSITGVDDIFYSITVTAKGGCTATDSVFIKVNKEPREIKVPNIFSPNGDGINDVWSIQSLNTFRNCKVVVFNRYGEKIFQSTGYNTPWDGKNKGQEVPFGTYYYLIEIPGRSKTSGYVTVIR